MLRAEGVRRGSPYSVRPVGGGRPLPDGRVQTGTLRLRIPSGARTGLYVVRVNSRGRTAAAPLAVAGRPVGGGSSARPLVVLPGGGLAGLQPVRRPLRRPVPDDLLSAGRAPCSAPTAAGLPLGARSQAAPLLAFLDRRAPALRPDHRPVPGPQARPLDRRGFGGGLAGDARWHLPVVARRLRRYVDDGGRVALFGADSLRRPVRLEGDVVTDPGARRPVDPFGERTELLADR